MCDPTALRERERKRERERESVCVCLCGMNLPSVALLNTHADYLPQDIFRRLNLSRCNSKEDKAIPADDNCIRFPWRFLFGTAWRLKQDIRTSLPPSPPKADSNLPFVVWGRRVVDNLGNLGAQVSKA